MTAMMIKSTDEYLKINTKPPIGGLDKKTKGEVMELANSFKPKECFRTIQNLFAQPKYTRLKIGMKAYVKLMCYCHLAGEQEITGLGRIKDNEIVDFKIPRQEVTGTTAQATDDAIIELMREIPIDEIPEWELDWHSHVDMQVFVSNTDEENYELMSMARGGKQFPLLVVNKKGEFCAKQFIHEGKCPNIVIELDVSKPLSDKQLQAIYNQCKIEVAERLQMKPVNVAKARSYNNWYKPTYQQTKFKNWGYSYDYDDCDRMGFNDDIVDGTDDVECKCQSCGVQLVSAREFENGLCDDCLEAWMSTGSVGK